MAISEMKIESFAELSQSVWDRIEKPIIAVYLDPDAIQTPKYLVKVYDGAGYTGIHMRKDDYEKVTEDIAIYVHWLKRAMPGKEDEPSLICAYI